MPDDAALALAHMLLSRFDTEVLMDTRQFLDTAIEQYEIVDQLDQPSFMAELQQVLIQFEAAIVLFVLFPLQKEFFLRADRAVLEPFGIVPGEYELNCAEEPLVELWELVREVLTDSVANGDTAVLQFQHSDGDAVDIQHQIGATLQTTFQRDFLDDNKVIFFWFAPIDQMHRLGDFASFGFDGHAVPQQVVDSVVVVVQ